MMEYITLGKTGLKVSRVGFRALHIQTTPVSRAIKILHRAVDSGINFFDTARAYTDSEKKLGLAFKGKRHSIIIATKIQCKTGNELLKLLKQSLKNLKTDYVDILQFHNPENLPDPSETDSLYRGLLESKNNGLARFIGITTHRITNAISAVKSNCFDTIQYPFSALSLQKEIEIVKLAKNIIPGLLR